MQPRNEFERQIEKAGQTLRPIPARQIQWAFNKCVTHYGRRTTKGIITCTECGHAWTDRNIQGNCHCPNCHTSLVIDDDPKRRVYRMEEYALFIQVCKEMQVLRFVYLFHESRVGHPAKYFHSEVVQRWIAPDGRRATRARLRPEFSFVSGWQYDSLLELRPDKPTYNLFPYCIHPQQGLLPELKRTGYHGHFYDISPTEMFCTLLRDSRAETLLKTKQIALLRHFAENACKLDDYWPSIRIAIRNAYEIFDAKTWCDYLDLLRFFGKDVRNAHYVCPDNLHAEHDRYVLKKRQYYRALAEEERKRRELACEDEYRKEKGRFFGLCFTDGRISVRVLESIEQVRLEGEAMHHCVFENEYYRKSDSLILSATMEGQRLETVEVSLSRLTVVQCRGLCNNTTPYHKQIIALVNRNMPLIQKRIAA